MAVESLSPEEIASLPASVLADIVLAFRAALYPDGNADQEWDAETLSVLGSVCDRHGLIPSDGDHAKRSVH